MSLEKFKTLKVMLGIPSNGVWFADFGLSLCNMLTYFARVRLGEYKEQTLVTHHVKGSVLPKSRYTVIKSAIAVKASHILFIDADQTFPKDLIHRLLARKVDVVGANIATKQIPANPTARRFSEKNLGGDLVYTDPNSTGLEEVWRLGCGVLMVSVKALQTLSPGYLSMPYVAEIDDYQGEDWTLCDALRAAGHKIYVDHDVSKEIGHIGYFTFTHEVIGQIVREEVPDVGDSKPQPRQAVG